MKKKIIIKQAMKNNFQPFEFTWRKFVPFYSQVLVVSDLKIFFIITIF